MWLSNTYASREGRSFLSKLGAMLAGIVLNIRRICEVIIGLAFIVAAFGAASIAYSDWKYYVTDPVTNGLTRFYLLVAFAVMLVGFGLYSIAKARSLR